jgi:hypothetical protein
LICELFVILRWFSLKLFLNLKIFSWLYELFTVEPGVSGGFLKPETESFLLLLWYRITEFPDL